MSQTSIEWAEHSINPIRARLNGRVGHHCVKVSPGCTNCYASTMQKRFGLPPFEVGKRKDVTPFLDESKLEEVLCRRKPTRYFWCDMSDLFGEWVPDEWIDQCFATMALTRRHTHMVLTKRARRMREYMSDSDTVDRVQAFVWEQIEGRVDPLERRRDDMRAVASDEWPLPNVWLGVSCEDQERANERTPELMQTLAAVRFLSLEPLLGPIKLHPQLPAGYKGDTIERWEVYPFDGLFAVPDFDWDTGKIHWVIIGGESGSKARPCNVQWIRDLVRQCLDAGVPPFVKQMGSKPYVENGSWPERQVGTVLNTGSIYLRHKKGGDPAEWPEDLRMREHPTATED